MQAALPFLRACRGNIAYSAAMVPGRAISPAELGSAIVYLASRETRMATGAVLAFDGGM